MGLGGNVEVKYVGEGEKSVRLGLHGVGGGSSEGVRVGVGTGGEGEVRVGEVVREGALWWKQRERRWLMWGNIWEWSNFEWFGRYTTCSEFGSDV